MAPRLTMDSTPETDYAKALTAANTLPKLKAVVTEWEKYAGEAYDAVMGWAESDFADWRKALASERHGKYMGDEQAQRFFMVLMPEPMFTLSVKALEYEVPLLLVERRLADLHLTYRDGKRLCIKQAKREDDDGNR